MKNNISNEQFMEWVEQYLDDTIPPETAKQLLDVLQNDSERMEQFCSQLQMEQLLKKQATDSIAETVLKKIQERSEAKIIRPRNWNRVILRAAAGLTIVLGIGFALKYSTPVEKENEEKASSEQVNSSSPVLVERPKMNLRKLQVPTDIKKTSAPKIRRQIVVHQQTAADSSAQVEEAIQTLDQSIVAAPSPAVDPSTASSGLGFHMGEMDLFGCSGSAPATRANISMPEVVGVRGGMGAATTLGSEAYAEIEENGWKSTVDTPLSTFSIDVDTASYANVRRFLSSGQLPPADAVRIEEMINYFEYSYAAPTDSTPFSTAMAATACPWDPTHQLLRVGLQGRRPDEGEDKPSNLVFLLDVSGSMSSADKLPLLKKGFEMMIKELDRNDRVAIVAYAGASGLVLNSTPADRKDTILNALNRLSSGGSTAGGAGIELAYRVAADHYIKGGINRVILATDGDFNVGISNLNDLQKLIERKRDTGVFLSVLGFGTGNLKDSTMELLADKGNGNYSYIDSEREANKVLVQQLSANMETIAKDVKIQIEFNPAVIRSYRLIGYENRVMAAQDFADDKKDAGEIGAGHQVTALYELITTDAPAAQDGVPLKYAPATDRQYTAQDEMLTLKLRYKEPEGSTSKLLSFPLKAGEVSKSMDESFRWAAAVAAFGQYLRESPYVSRYSIDEIMELAQSAVVEDSKGYRSEFIGLIRQLKELENRSGDGSEYPQWQYRN
ncbi:MAG: VWA domain-containing protein [Pontiellaceae bacterium]|nr:VWA domain-containing protein [Pontiellaceae bacterium]MBN2786202.1 VWA domain-containing protein [Pontiellaceae bacterium]